MTKFANSAAWGVSIAMSWTWGLGLFFSVQMALQFGLAGLIFFLIPNALGLVIFGALTQRIADRCETATRFEKAFFESGYSLRYLFFLYQITAISLTFFGLFYYLFQPAGVQLGLFIMIAAGAAMALGEQFTIGGLKYSHMAMFLMLVLAGATAATGFSMTEIASQETGFTGRESLASWNFAGLLFPILAGFLTGPWLDLQQWQRAIQIKREEGSVFRSYLIGALIFFAILFFHGVLALAVVNAFGAENFSTPAGQPFHEKDFIVRMFFGDQGVPVWVAGGYSAFLCLAVLSTLDSGHVALRWFMKKWAQRSENIIMTVIPESAVASPFGPMIGSALIAGAAVLLTIEIEYFMTLYGSFFIGYSVLLIFRSVFMPQFSNFSQGAYFSVAAFSLGSLGIGYLEELPIMMAIGALTPLIHSIMTISSRVVVEDLSKALPRERDSETAEGDPVEPESPQPESESISGKAAQQAVQALESAIKRLDPKTAEQFHNVIQRVEPTAAQALTTVIQAIQTENGSGGSSYQDDEMVSAKGHFEGKWFCYTFMATYYDTNSVGNVYFGMYPLYVGKVREMFFNVCMPNFDLNSTSFYILTRAFEHKFIMEAREFEYITVKIRVADFNRKFATLEHQILNSAQQVLGKGKQVLLFVSSKDYRIVDLPDQVKQAFLPHI